ncbi:MAG TPA: hypothetical protein VKA55_08625 [Gammaproteobacteria bacterium]|nr:hypothetical protein [Gammaproteobacteria bacterium]
MAFQFQELFLADENELVPAGQGDWVLVGVELRFADEDSGAQATVTAQVPVLGLVRGRTLDQVHEEAATRAEDLVGTAAEHLRENDPLVLARIAQGS